MFRCWNLLLVLFCFINYSETPIVGNIHLHVTGQKGENATLPCNIEARDIFHVIFNSQSKNIFKCEIEECKSENSRVFKKGSCDVVIKDLKLSDAGKYILKVYYTNDTTEVERLIREYHLQIHDEISVKKGEDLKLDVLLINADKVERNSSSGWAEIWTRGHGVNSDRLTDRDGNLTINRFTNNDTGTYRVLDSEGETLITVTVTETPRTDYDHKPNGTEHKIWIIVPCVGGALLALVAGVIAIKKCQNHYFQPADQNADNL